MCISDCFPAKTLCRLYAFFNVFLGMLSLYYWELLLSFTDKISLAPTWDSVLSTNKEVVKEQCGNNYLKTVNPYQFGTIFKNSIHLYITACVIFSAKGFIQFFITCCNPVLARSLSITILAIDLFASGLILYALHIFRSPKLCLLEYTDVFQYPGQQSQMTLMSIVFLAAIKPPELLSLICFMRDQSLLISNGETRSKGVRRSEAFRTPMASRANVTHGEYLRVPSHRQRTKLSADEELLQTNSDEDEDVEIGNNDPFKFDMTNANPDGRILGKDEYVEIDLNDNTNETGKDFPVSILHVQNSKFGNKTGQRETTHAQQDNARNGNNNNI